MSAMHNADRYPTGVPKLGPLHTECDWIDRDQNVWRYDEWFGWRRSDGGGWWGSFSTVEGAGPYLALKPPVTPGTTGEQQQ